VLIEWLSSEKSGEALKEGETQGMREKWWGSEMWGGRNSMRNVVYIGRDGEQRMGPSAGV